MVTRTCFSCTYNFVLASHCNQNGIGTLCYCQQALCYLHLDLVSLCSPPRHYTRSCGLLSFPQTHQAHSCPKAFNLARLLTVSLYGHLLFCTEVWCNGLFPVLPGKTLEIHWFLWCRRLYSQHHGQHPAHSMCLLNVGFEGCLTD